MSSVDRLLIAALREVAASRTSPLWDTILWEHQAMVVRCFLPQVMQIALRQLAVTPGGDDPVDAVPAVQWLLQCGSLGGRFGVSSSIFWETRTSATLLAGPWIIIHDRLIRDLKHHTPLIYATIQKQDLLLQSLRDVVMEPQASGWRRSHLVREILADRASPLHNLFGPEIHPTGAAPRASTVPCPCTQRSLVGIHPSRTRSVGCHEYRFVFQADDGNRAALLTLLCLLPRVIFGIPFDLTNLIGRYGAYVLASPLVSLVLSDGAGRDSWVVGMGEWVTRQLPPPLHSGFDGLPRATSMGTFVLLEQPATSVPLNGWDLTDRLDVSGTLGPLAESAARQSYVGYVLGLGDRSFDNIWLETDEGVVTQTDFGFLFGHSPKPAPPRFPLLRLLLQGRLSEFPLDETKQLLRSYLLGTPGLRADVEWLVVLAATDPLLDLRQPLHYVKGQLSDTGLLEARNELDDWVSP